MLSVLSLKHSPSKARKLRCDNQSLADNAMQSVRLNWRENAMLASGALGVGIARSWKQVCQNGLSQLSKIPRPVAQQERPDARSSWRPFHASAATTTSTNVLASTRQKNAFSHKPVHAGAFDLSTPSRALREAARVV